MKFHKTLLLFIFLILSISVLSQTGGIMGNTTETQRKQTEVIPCVFVKIINSKETRSDWDGNYIIEEIPAGNYKLIASYMHKKNIYKDITIIEDSIIKVDIEFICQYDVSYNNKICPVCEKIDSVIPTSTGGVILVDGYNSANSTTSKYIGDKAPPCHPHWYCKRDCIYF